MRLLLLVLLSLGTVGASAQSAANQYHDAARLYIDGQMEEAEQAAVAGLAIDANDVKLQALLERIRQQQEQPQQQQTGEGNDGERNEEPQDEQDNQGESGPQDSDEQNDRQGDADLPQDDSSAEPDRQNEQPEPEQQEIEDGGRPEPDQQQPGEDGATPDDDRPIQPGKMSRAEAERILGALRADESALLRSIQRLPANPRRVERDW